jgi:hypothetical protein
VFFFRQAKNLSGFGKISIFREAAIIPPKKRNKKKNEERHRKKGIYFCSVPVAISFLKAH